MVNSFRHVGVVVHDVDRALDFWINTFNFNIISDNQEPSPYIDTLLNLTSPDLRTIKLKDHKGFILELLHFRNLPGTEVSNQELTSTGLTHIAITLEDLKSLYDKLVENGYEPLSEILIPPNRKVKVVFFKGPENLLLELVEEL